MGLYLGGPVSRWVCISVGLYLGGPYLGGPVSRWACISVGLYLGGPVSR